MTDLLEQNKILEKILSNILTMMSVNNNNLENIDVYEEIRHYLYGTKKIKDVTEEECNRYEFINTIYDKSYFMVKDLKNSQLKNLAIKNLQDFLEKNNIEYLLKSNSISFLGIEYDLNFYVKKNKIVTNLTTINLEAEDIRRLCVYLNKTPQQIRDELYPLTLERLNNITMKQWNKVADKAVFKNSKIKIYRDYCSHEYYELRGEQWSRGLIAEMDLRKSDNMDSWLEFLKDIVVDFNDDYLGKSMQEKINSLVLEIERDGE